MATPKRSALGRGLDALISMDNIVTSGTSSIHEIELSQIVPNPDQPRREFDQEALEELASSIRELGIIQPISLRQVDGGNYQIIAGERRYRAAQMAGLETIPAYVNGRGRNVDGDGSYREHSTGRLELHRDCIGLPEIDRIVSTDTGKTE